MEKRWLSYPAGLLGSTTRIRCGEVCHNTGKDTGYGSPRAEGGGGGGGHVRKGKVQTLFSPYIF
jgi:hypothetical protein